MITSTPPTQAVAERPTEKLNDLDVENLFSVTLRDSGEVALNVGVGEDISIADLARLVAETVGVDVELKFDASKPDGTPRKLVDVSRLTALGWTAQTSLRDGLRRTYDDYLQALEQDAIRG